MNTLLSTSAVLAGAEMEPRLFDLDFQLLADSLLLMLAIFALFLIMSYLLFNPAREFLKKRQDKIKAELEDAKSNQSQAAALREDYEARLKNIDKEAEEILSEARKKALVNENRIIAEAKTEAAAILEHAREEARLEKQKMADDVKKEIVSVAAMMAEKVVGSTIDAAMQNGLIEDTLKEIGDNTWLS